MGLVSKGTCSLQRVGSNWQGKQEGSPAGMCAGPGWSHSFQGFVGQLVEVEADMAWTTEAACGCTTTRC